MLRPLARVIRVLPDSRRRGRQRVVAFATDLMDGCIAHQRADGLFHDVIDRPDTFHGEQSGADVGLRRLDWHIGRVGAAAIPCRR